MTLLFCTIEQYEHILEKYGPDAVQSVVRELGHLWARNLRSSDLLARLREDKLAILLPHTSIEQSQIVWERLLTRMSEHPFTLKEENYFISVKAVAVSIHPEMPELESIIARTEEMLRDHDESSLLTLQLEN